MKKIILLIIMLLVFIQTVTAYGMCDGQKEINENCTMLTPSLVGCSAYTYAIWNLTGADGIELENDTLTSFSGDVYQFNFTQPEGYYIVKLCDGSTREVISKPERTKTVLAIIILAPLILGLFLLIGAATLSETHAVLKIALFLSSIITFWISMHYAVVVLIEYYTFVNLQETIGDTVYYIGLLFVALVSYFIIYWIVITVKDLRQEKKDRLLY